MQVSLSKRKYSPTLLLIVTFLVASPLCDLLTGIFIMRGISSEGALGSPSQILRILFLISGLFLLKKKHLSYFIVFTFYFLALESSSFFWASSGTSFFKGLNLSFKLLYIYMLYTLLSDLLLNKKVSIYLLLELFYFSAFIYAIAIIIPYILGIGISNYAEGTFGTKGFFASGNGLGPYLGIVSAMLLLKKNKLFKEKLFLIAIYFALMLLGTKASFLFLCVNLILYLSIISVRKRFRILFLIFIVLFTFYNEIYSTLSVIYDVVIYRFENSTNLCTFLLSGRDLYVEDALKELYISDLFYLRLFFGGGALLSFQTINIPNVIWDTLEMDFFDVLFMYGFIGVLFYLGIIIRVLNTCFRQKNYFFIVFLAFFFHSILAGHILFNGMSVMAGVMLYTFIKCHDNEVDNYYYYTHS